MIEVNGVFHETVIALNLVLGHRVIYEGIRMSLNSLGSALFDNA